MLRRLLAVLFLLMTLVACGGGGGDGEDEPSGGGAPAAARTTPPPWPLGDNQAQRILDAGLPHYQAEGDKVHYHAHLDVFYNGEPVLVPPGIGIDLDEEVISPLHTHQPSGIVHIEAEEEADFSLAQLFIQWGIEPDLAATVYVNGEQVQGGLRHVIKPSTQIAVVFGTPPAEIPSTYDCGRSPTDACDRIPQP